MGKPSLIIVALLWVLVSGAAALDYVTDIMPIFDAKCFKCHSKRERVSKGSLELDNLADMEGIYIGPHASMIPGKPDESDLVRYVSDPADTDTMPPKGKGDRLTPEEIDKVKKWLAEGAAVRPGKTPPKPSGPTPPPVYQVWANAEGKEIKARFLGLHGDQVDLLLESGIKYSYPIGKLHPRSQTLARELAAK
jgi:mono/diheme cytochrome c family protein